MTTVRISKGYTEEEAFRRVIRQAGNGPWRTVHTRRRWKWRKVRVKTIRSKAYLRGTTA